MSQSSKNERVRTNQKRQSDFSRKKAFNKNNVIILSCLFVVLIICIFIAVRIFGEKSKEVSEMVPAEVELKKDVAVDGVSITGLSKDEAKKLLLDQYIWDIKLTYLEKEYIIENPLENLVDELLEEIYSGEPKETYSIDMTSMEEQIRLEVEQVAQMWDVPPVNGVISSFNKETNQFVYFKEENGVVIDQEALVSEIMAKLSAKEFNSSIPVVTQEVAPELTQINAKDRYQVIGTYTTTTTKNSDRNRNIELAAESMNGMILQPGEEFSFNQTTGERSEKKGYRPAGAYVNGKLVEEPGGGVCQVSSTLYNAVIFSGLITTERSPHSYEPSYVPSGEDAMVSFGSSDMKFKNNSQYPIAIRTGFADRQLKISIVGIPILENGMKVYMSTKKVGDLDPPPPIYEEDQTLELNVEKEVTPGVKGTKWVTNLVVEKDGKVLKDEFLHNSSYRGKSAVIKRNTSGVVVPTQTQAVEETHSQVAPQETAPTETSQVPTIPSTESIAPSSTPMETKGPQNQAPEIESIPTPSIEVEKGPGIS